MELEARMSSLCYRGPGQAMYLSEPWFLYLISVMEKERVRDNCPLECHLMCLFFLVAVEA